MGNILLARGDAEGAVEHLRLATRARPDAAEVRAALERAETLLGSQER